jgi:hypothetical protein
MRHVIAADSSNTNAINAPTPYRRLDKLSEVTFSFYLPRVAGRTAVAKEIIGSAAWVREVEVTDNFAPLLTIDARA